MTTFQITLDEQDAEAISQKARLAGKSPEVWLKELAKREAVPAANKEWISKFLASAPPAGQLTWLEMESRRALRPMKRVFVDTNIFAYAFDLSADQKRRLADSAIASLRGPEVEPWISTQILQEYYNVLTRKFGFPAVRAKAELVVLDAISTVLMTPDLIKVAADLHAAHSVSFWDALVIAAAQSVDCDEIWTEDLQTGRSFGKLKIFNPLAAPSAGA